MVRYIYSKVSFHCNIGGDPVGRLKVI